MLEIIAAALFPGTHPARYYRTLGQADVRIVGNWSLPVGGVWYRYVQ